MKRLSLVLMSSIAFMFVACGDDSGTAVVIDPAEVTTGVMTDSRDGQTYKTVTIGTQTWMAQNLNFETENSYCYDDKASYCAKYGRLYKWAAAMEACPAGWHLPTKAEFKTLFTAVGGSSIADVKLKSSSGWYSGGNNVSGTDDYSFSALPAGGRDYYCVWYFHEGNSAYFWSSTEDDSNNAYRMRLDSFDGYAYLERYYNTYGFSVRCVKDLQL